MKTLMWFLAGLEWALVGLTSVIAVIYPGPITITSAVLCWVFAFAVTRLAVDVS